MSKLFYDDIINLDKIEKHIKRISSSFEEREEYYRLVDEIAHHRVIGCILDKLPGEDHEKFMKRFTKKPHAKSHFKFLNKRIAEDVEGFVKAELEMFATEILGMLEDKVTSKAKK